MIRTATIDDLPGIMAIENASFGSDAWSEAMMRAELESEHGRYIVLDDGRINGYAGLRHLAGGRDSDVQTIAVSARARGAGHGRALLNELISTAVSRRAREVFLDVRADNPVAEALYASEGFVEIGRRARYYQPDDVDAVVMKLDVQNWPAPRARSADEPQ